MINNGKEECMKIRGQLITEIAKKISVMNKPQAEIAKAINVSQPRLSDIVRGKTDKFSIDALIAIAINIGVGVKINLEDIQP